MLKNCNISALATSQVCTQIAPSGLPHVDLARASCPLEAGRGGRPFASPPAPRERSIRPTSPRPPRRRERRCSSSSSRSSRRSQPPTATSQRRPPDACAEVANVLAPKRSTRAPVHARPVPAQSALDRARVWVAAADPDRRPRLLNRTRTKGDLLDSEVLAAEGEGSPRQSPATISSPSSRMAARMRASVTSPKCV